MWFFGDGVAGMLVDWKGHEDTFWDIGNVLYLEMDCGYLDIYVCKIQGAHLRSVLSVIP